jgi:pimeloyl-ACP methyl ester carboxylesterase
VSQPTHLILLPGLHGTDDLWPPLLSAIPADIPRTIVTYPPQQVLSRDELIAVIERALPADGQLLLIAESFSGPLAIELASRIPDRVALLVLCATFASPPWSVWFCRMLAIAARRLFRPMMILRAWMPNRLMDATIGRAEHDALRHLTSAVVASRMKIVAQTNCRDALLHVKAPILYLRGSRDWAVPVRCMQEIQRLLPRTRVAVIDSSHMVLQRRPREAWSAIEATLRI